VQGEASITTDTNRTCASYDVTVGVDDGMATVRGRMRSFVYADRIPMWQPPLVQKDKAAVPPRASLTGKKTLRLFVEPRTRFELVALADWAGSRFRCQ